jgi:glycosyltransferase involved in cell wall biosynthesis
VRVAWIVYGGLDQPTGGYIYDRLIVEGLRARGDEVTVVDPVDVTRAVEEVDVLVGDALCVRELGPLFEAIRSPAARVLLVHHLPSWETERTDRESMSCYEARALASSDHIIATGAVTRARLTTERPAFVVDVVMPGADRLPCAPRHAGAGPIELLFVGSLIARKRVGLLLDALESLPDPLPKLTLVGDPDREPAYRRAIAERIGGSVRLRANATIAGIVDDEALVQWLARTDALVLPSSLEGYGMVLTEALHAGLPLIAARPVLAAASLESHGAALGFDGAGDLGEVLRRFTSEPALRDALRRAAAASSLPTWSRTVDSFRRALVHARNGVSRNRP